MFKEKTASIILTHHFYTSTYYSSQNSDADFFIYRAILNYCISKKINGVKYCMNNNGDIQYFDNNNEDILLNKKINMITKVTNSNNSQIYMIELFSYICDQSKIYEFINYCKKKYNKKLDLLNKHIIGNPNQKYFRYIGYNNASSTCIYEEHKFFSNKTFDNIFFEGKDEFIKKIKYFCDNKNNFRELGIPYTHGILCWGPAGTGKTYTAVALAVKALKNKEIKRIEIAKKSNISKIM
jgi:DNA replication protein DnaC